MLHQLFQVSHALVAQQLGEARLEEVVARRVKHVLREAEDELAKIAVVDAGGVFAWLDHRFPKLAGFRVRPACQPEDFRSDGVERENLVRQSGVGHRARHSPYRAAGLVLGKHAAAVFANRAAAP